MTYIELQVTSNYSFLRGASSVEELLTQATAFGYDAIALTDRNSLAGIARAHQRAREVGIRLVIGCRLDLVCGAALLVYPLDRAGYGGLCRMLRVSRNTVHEAFGRLRAAEIVEVRRGRTGGAYVRESWNDASAAAVRRTLVPRRSELDELCDLRCRYEEVVARTAAELHTPAEGDELRRLVTVFRATVTPQGQHAADIAVHEAVLAATHNPQMAVLSHELLAKVSLGLPIEPYEPTFHHRAAREHAALVEAIVERRIEDAGRLAREHFSMSTRTLRAVLERGAAETRDS